MVIDITLTCLSRISAAFLAGCCPFFSLNLHNTQSITATQLCRRPLARLHRARIECMWVKRREAPFYPHAFPKACPGPRSASALIPGCAARLRHSLAFTGRMRKRAKRLFTLCPPESSLRRLSPALSPPPGPLHPTPPLLPGFYWMDEKTREAPLYPHAFPKACPGPRSASALTPARAAPPHPATAPWLLLEDEKMRFAHFLILQ